MARPETEGNQGARVGNRFVLPPMVRLVAPKRLFGGGVPFAAGLATQVVLPHQGLLNLPGSFRVDLLLTVVGH